VESLLILCYDLIFRSPDDRNCSFPYRRGPLRRRNDHCSTFARLWKSLFPPELCSRNLNERNFAPPLSLPLVGIDIKAASIMPVDLFQKLAAICFLAVGLFSAISYIDIQLSPTRTHTFPPRNLSYYCFSITAGLIPRAVC
jgi:hypothetical protein